MRIILLLLISIQFTIAGGEVGNGGDAVVCFDRKDGKVTFEKILKSGKDPFDNSDVVKSIISMETLDSYEYRIEKLFTGIVPDLYHTSLDYRDIVVELLERLEKKSSFSKYVDRARENLPEDGWVVAPGIPEIRDEGYAVKLESNCSLVQMAEQVGNKVFVDPAIFRSDKMSELSRATLLLHEFIYNIALDYGHENSFPTRQVVGHLISGSGWENITTHELNTMFAELLTSKPFFLSGNYQVGEQTLWLESFSRENKNENYIDHILFHSNGNIKEATSAKDQFFYENENELEIYKGMKLFFSPDGKILSIK